MPQAIALVVCDLEKSRLGLRSRLGDELGGRSVLGQTVAKVSRVAAVRSVVLVHPAGQSPGDLLGGEKFDKPVTTFAAAGGLCGAQHGMRRAARAWALMAWRGGLGGATCYDELLPAGPLVAAMAEHDAESAMLVGGDWPCVDAGYCQAVLERHLANPQAMAMTFTQAPPGLAGIAIGMGLLGELAEKGAMIGQMLSYNPMSPQADPIGRDVCLAIEPEVRSCQRRFVYDTNRSAALIDAAAAALGARFEGAPARAVVQSVAAGDDQGDGGGAGGAGGMLPQQITIELTPQRAVTGPITPHHLLQFERGPMPLATAVRIVEQLGEDGDTAVTFGGLGDALLYEDWRQVVQAAHAAEGSGRSGGSGALAIELQTDLLVDQGVLEQVIDSPVDVVSVRLNADTARTYEAVMGVDAFATVAQNLEWLLRNRRAGLPWIVPRLVKTRQTLDDMEPFFDRWIYFMSAAVIEPATTGCGLIADQSVMDMSPPRRTACRQLGSRMTIHSDGRVALCDQDWLGRAAPGDASALPLAEIWPGMQSLRQIHADGRWEEMELCAKCSQWHRP